jgi:hypothetical protein
LRYLSCLAGLALAFATSSAAATIELLGFVQDDDKYTNVLPVAQSGRVDIDVTGNRDGLYSDVYRGTSLAGVTPFNSIQARGTLTYARAGGDGRSFTLIWGTVDAYNVLAVSGDTGREVISGDMILNLMNNPSYGVSNVIVRITPDIPFSTVILGSGRNSFEHAFNPPELEDFQSSSLGGSIHLQKVAVRITPSVR